MIQTKTVDEKNKLKNASVDREIEREKIQKTNDTLYLLVFIDNQSLKLK